MKPTRYWLAVASKKPINREFTQACHGKAVSLKRIHISDYLLYYLGKEVFNKLLLCQPLTAIGLCRMWQFMLFKTPLIFILIGVILIIFPLTQLPIDELFISLVFVLIAFLLQDY